MTVTRVHFRKFATGEVIALFPDDPEGRRYDRTGSTIASFMHVGQHSPASAELIDVLDPATPDEYAPLKAELEGRGYRLQVEP